MLKTQTNKIPQLDLFVSRKRRSPTKEQISYHQHKVLRDSDIYRNSQKISKSPHRSYISTQRPLLQQAMLFPPHATTYINSPSTYLQCADQYLAYGYPLYYPRTLETGRFNQSDLRIRQQQIIRREKQRTRRMFETSVKNEHCFCQSESVNPGCFYPQKNRIYKKQNNISKQTYLTNNAKKVPKSQFNNNKESSQKTHNFGPHKAPYIHHHTSREQKYNININQPKKQVQHKKTHNNTNVSNVFQTFFGNKHVTENQSINQPQNDNNNNNNNNTSQNNGLNLSLHIDTRQKKQLVQQGTQTAGQQKNQVNKSSVLFEKMMRSIPVMLDEQSFRKLLKEQTKQFHSIKLDLDEQYPTIDFEDILQTKNQYFQHSHELLHRLDKLTGSPMALIGQIFNKKIKKGIIWPDMSEHQAARKIYQKH